MLDSLFQISQKSSEEGVFSYEAKVDGASPIFEGHFPDKPIVPGVATLYAIKLCVEDYFGKAGLSYESIREVKFLSMILPQEDSTLDINFTYSVADSINIRVQVYSKDSLKLKLVASLK